MGHSLFVGLQRKSGSTVVIDRWGLAKWRSSVKHERIREIRGKKKTQEKSEWTVELYISSGEEA
jgi:hypothetical protein